MKHQDFKDVRMLKQVIPDAHGKAPKLSIAFWPLSCMMHVRAVSTFFYIKKHVAALKLFARAYHDEVFALKQL